MDNEMIHPSQPGNTTGTTAEEFTINNHQPSVYCLGVKLNGQPLTMLIDSGSHDSLINVLVWQELGEPQLQPTDSQALSGTGTEIEFLGTFIAEVQQAGRIFWLPVTVSGQTDIPNLIGRRWFPASNVDWNEIFRRTASSGSNVSSCHRFQEFSANKSQLILEMNRSWNTNEYSVQVEVEGEIIDMTLDTGAELSIVGLAQWENLGKPRLHPERQIILRDAANRGISLEGVCEVQVKYGDIETIILPLLVNADLDCSVLGINWFPSLRFDFNSIFDNLTFHN